MAQLRVTGKTKEHKTALELLKIFPLKGTLFTGDAAFTQRDFCEAVIAGGGDYFLTVKENQPTLEADIRKVLAPFHRSRTTAQGLFRKWAGTTKDMVSVWRAPHTAGAADRRTALGTYVHRRIEALPQNLWVRNRERNPP